MAEEGAVILVCYNVCCSLIMLLVLGSFGIYEGNNLKEDLIVPTSHLNQVADDWQ